MLIYLYEIIVNVKLRQFNIKFELIYLKQSLKGIDVEMEKLKDLLKKVLTREIIMYLIFGVLTTVVSLAVYYLLIFTVLNPENAIQLQIANILSWVAGVAFAYITNRKYVFESNEKNKVKELGKFVTSRLVTLVLDMLIMFVGVTLLKGNDKILKLISQVLVIIGNYVFSKIFVFKKKK